MTGKLYRESNEHTIWGTIRMYCQAAVKGNASGVLHSRLDGLPPLTPFISLSGLLPGGDLT